MDCKHHYQVAQYFKPSTPASRIIYKLATQFQQRTSNGNLLALIPLPFSWYLSVYITKVHIFSLYIYIYILNVTRQKNLLKSWKKLG